MNSDDRKERIFLIGNGASLNIEKDLSNILLGGLNQLHLSIIDENSRDTPSVILNILDDIRMGFEELFCQLQNLFLSPLIFRTAHRKQEIEAFTHLYDSFLRLKQKDNFEYIKAFVQKYSIEYISKYIFERAYDSSDGGYGTKAFKKNRLIGPLDGSLIQCLENLQISILRLLCYKKQNCVTEYDDFVRLLKKEKEKKVISLNWDNFFEQAFRRVNHEEEPLHIFIPNQIAIDTDRHTYVNDAYKLFKPHGSLEYYCCQSSDSHNTEGCFRITVVPQEIVKKRISYPANKCLFFRKLRTCKYHHNLQSFVQPYTRIERSLRSIPFVRMALEASKSFLPRNYELIVVGYSFSRDRKGWIDYDLLPLFLSASRIRIISKGVSSGRKVKKNMLQEIPTEPNSIVVENYTGFQDYINKSKQVGYLL